MKKEMKSKKSDKSEWESERRSMNSKLAALEKKYKKVLEEFQNKNGSINEELEAVNGENTCLHKQLDRVSQQLNDMTSSGLNTSGSADANTSMASAISSNDEEINSAQLTWIIKYLRKEKDILSGRVEVLQAETARMQSQLELQV